MLTPSLVRVKNHLQVLDTAGALRGKGWVAGGGVILLSKIQGKSAGDLDLGAGNKLCRKQKCECA